MKNDTLRIKTADLRQINKEVCQFRMKNADLEGKLNETQRLDDPIHPDDPFIGFRNRFAQKVPSQARATH